MQYTTERFEVSCFRMLFYQDFKDTFVCNTQRYAYDTTKRPCCFIRISKILLYAIHNFDLLLVLPRLVVLSGFQRYFCMQYTTSSKLLPSIAWLFYQDFKDTFVCNTQRNSYV